VDRLMLIVDEVEKQLRWKRNKTTVGITVPFYVTTKEEEILSNVYTITREPQDRINFKRRNGLSAFIRDNEIWIRRNHGNKKRRNHKFHR